MAQMGNGAPGGPRRPGPGGGGRPPGGGRGGPPQRGGKGPRSPAAEARREGERKAQELAQRSGIPLERARRVAAGHEKLADVIEDLAFRARVDVLMGQHDLNRALATQIELGHASLEAVLDRRRVDEELARSRDRSVLDEQVGKGEITLGVHGRKALRVRLLAVDKYELDYEEVESGEKARLHKLQVKYAFRTDDYKKVRKSLDYDEARRAGEVPPVPRPQDRYACSDRRLGTAWVHKTSVSATTLEGERFTGEIAWIARYEVGLRVKGDTEVVVFRHALDLLEEHGRAK